VLRPMLVGSLGQKPTWTSVQYRWVRKVRSEVGKIRRRLC